MREQSTIARIPSASDRHQLSLLGEFGDRTVIRVVEEAPEYVRPARSDLFKRTCEFLRSLHFNKRDHGFELACPREAARRGSQVSFTHPEGYTIMQALIARGVIGDFRAPDVLRFGFAALYLRYTDIWDAVAVLKEVMATRAWDRPEFKARKAVT